MNNYNSNSFENIKDPNTALVLLKTNMLISKPYQGKESLYSLMSDGKILVVSENYKYYINKYQFIEDFYLSKFYIYDEYNNIDINNEFSKLR